MLNINLPEHRLLVIDSSLKLSKLLPMSLNAFTLTKYLEFNLPRS